MIFNSSLTVASSIGCCPTVYDVGILALFLTESVLVFFRYVSVISPVQLLRVMQLRMTGWLPNWGVQWIGIAPPGWIGFMVGSNIRLSTTYSQGTYLRTMGVSDDYVVLEIMHRCTVHSFHQIDMYHSLLGYHGTTSGRWLGEWRTCVMRLAWSILVQGFLEQSRWQLCHSVRLPWKHANIVMLNGSWEWRKALLHDV